MLSGLSTDYDIELIEPIILQKKALLKNSKEMHESDRLLAELDGLDWVQAANCNTLLMTRKVRTQKI